MCSDVVKEPKKTTGRGGYRPGGGRPKGSLDKGNKLIRELIVESLHGLGGVEYLQRVAESHPAAYLSLIGKVLPVQVEGSDGGPILHRIERAIVDPKA